ncbi:MAG: hypothetical protein JW806_03795 [Sedimentisphaerales bacterium]|nr:hypothetical protein [Sedimentisphaerales bacterium]
MNYQKIKFSGRVLQLLDEFPAKAFGQIIPSFTDGQRSSFEPLGSSRFAKVFKFDIYLKSRVYSLILKQYLNRSAIDIAKNFLRPCRAQRALNAAQMLKQHGLDTPDVIAVGIKNIAGVTVKNFLITAYISDSTPLHQMLSSQTADRDKLIAQFGQTVGKMHAENIFHGDLRLGNVLVKKDDNKFIFFFLDNERTKKFKTLPWRLRLKNLVQVYMFAEGLTDEDKNIFLDSYLAQQNIEIDRKKLVDEVTAWTNRRLAERGIQTKTA